MIRSNKIELVGIFSLDHSSETPRVKITHKGDVMDLCEFIAREFKMTGTNGRTLRLTIERSEETSLS